MRSPRFICLKAAALTTVELLVVIAITVAMCVLLLPANIQTRQKAKAVKCLGNVRTIGIALNAYLADRGTYPGSYIVMTPKKQYWWLGLDYYVSGKEGDPSADIPEWARCPAKKRKFGTQGAGFGYNTVQFGYLPPTMLRPVQVVNASSAIVLGDNADDGMNPSTIGILHKGMFASRHLGGGHYLYADGHIEWKSATDTEQEWNPKPF